MKLHLFRNKIAQPVVQKRSEEYVPAYWGNSLSIDLGNPTLPMKIATVYRCVDVLSGSVASLSLQVKRKKIDYFVVDDDNPLNILLNLCPNPRLNAFDLIKNLIIQMLLTGNAYILPQYAGGVVNSLILLSPNSVTYEKNYNYYLVHDTVNSIYDKFMANEIIHLRNISIDGGYTGLSTVSYASTVLGINAAADKQSNDIFQPGSTSRGFISGDETVTKGFGQVQDDQLKTVGERIESELRSGKKIMSLPGAMKFNPLSMSPADLQLLDSKKFTVLEICRFFGVHPDKLFAGQSTNYKSSEMSQVQYLTDTLQPILRKIETEFTIKLIPRSLFGKCKIQFNMEDFYQTDFATKSDYMQKTIQNGIYTVNEWRKKEGKEPVDGGDVAFISCNVAPIDSAKIKGETNKYQKKVDDTPKK